MRAIVSLLAGACLLIGACGSESGESAGEGARREPGDSYPASVAAANGTVTLDRRPTAIVSLSPTATEMLFAIGAGDQVTAVDDQSDYPPEAPTTDLSGFEPNVEAIAGYEPDLAIISGDTGGLGRSLESLDIPVLLQPAAADLDDSYAQIEQLGVLTGHVGEASEVVSSMQSDIDDIVGSVPEFATAPTYYHELDTTYFTATSKTFIGRVYSLLGLRNIADEAPGAGSGFPQLSAEFIVEADPDFIFLADTECCEQDAATVSSRPGWDGIRAVETGAVVEMSDDIASRWGPRIVDFLRSVASAVDDFEPASR